MARILKRFPGNEKNEDAKLDSTISEVFSLMADDAGIVVNPFAPISKPTMDKEPR